MSRWEQHNLANQLRPDQKRLGLLRQPVQAQSVQPRLVQPRPVQPAFQPTNVMDAPVSNMPSARQQRLDKYANTLTNMSLFATLATGKSIRDYGAAFRTQPTDQKDKVQDQIYSNIGALLQKARAAGVDLSDQRKVYELGTQAGITDPRYMKVLLDAAKNSRAPARETDFTSFYDKGGNESRYIKGTQGYSDAVENKNLTTQKPTAYDLGTLWNAKGESITYKNRQQELAAREVGFNRASPPSAADAKKYDAFSFHGPNGERRKGYRKHVDGVPRYFFSDDGAAVPANWRVGSPTEQPKTSSTTGGKVPTQLAHIPYLQAERQKLAGMTEGTDEYALAARNLAELEREGENLRWGPSAGPRKQWAETTADYYYNTDLINRMFEQLDNVNVTTGALASGLGVAEGIASQLVQTGELTVATIKGKAATHSDLRSSEHYNWGDASEQTGAFKANITDLAYSLARMAEKGGGKLSDADVQKQIDRITPGGGMSKSRIAAALLEVDRGLYRRINSLHRSNMESGYPVENFKLVRGRLLEGSRNFLDADGVERKYNILYSTDPSDPENSKVRMKWLAE